MAVSLLDPAAGGDAGLVEQLTDLINGVYATAEHGLWRDGATRTTPSELAGLIEAREIAVATVGGRLVGAVRVQAISDATGEFGMLVADPEYRGIGVGRALIAFAERHSRDRGLRAMQLELLVPRTWRHPSKVFLDDWYRRIGYRVIRTISLDDMYAELSPLLATPCELVVYEKPLEGMKPG
ncbi:MAG TPA: GNAT family N-acetyltransferase [Solirubrobacteraceae bacterium]